MPGVDERDVLQQPADVLLALKVRDSRLAVRERFVAITAQGVGARLVVARTEHEPDGLLFG